MPATYVGPSVKQPYSLHQRTDPAGAHKIHEYRLRHYDPDEEGLWHYDHDRVRAEPIRGQLGASGRAAMRIADQFEVALSPFDSEEDNRRPAHSSTLRQAIMQARAQNLDTLTQLKAACVALDKMERRLIEHIQKLHMERPPTRFPQQGPESFLELKEAQEDTEEE